MRRNGLCNLGPPSWHGSQHHFELSRGNNKINDVVFAQHTQTEIGQISGDSSIIITTSVSGIISSILARPFNEAQMTERIRVGGQIVPTSMIEPFNTSGKGAHMATNDCIRNPGDFSQDFSPTGKYKIKVSAYSNLGEVTANPLGILLPCSLVLVESK